LFRSDQRTREIGGFWRNQVRDVSEGDRVRSSVSALPLLPKVSYSRLMPLWVAAMNIR
jgi:hypothetical protein